MRRSCNGFWRIGKRIIIYANRFLIKIVGIIRRKRNILCKNITENLKKKNYVYINKRRKC